MMKRSVLVLFIVGSAYANVLTTGLWSTHNQPATIRADVMIEQHDHFMWPRSPVPPRHIAVVVLDGYLEDGTRFARAPGIFYNDVESMAREYMRDMFISSHGHVRYEAIDLIVISNAPMRRLGSAEGNVYTNFSLDAFYDRCVENPNRGPLHVDNDGSTMDAHCIRETLKNITMTTGVTLFDAATNGVVHEIVFLGPHKTFQWETSMCGAHPLWINGASAPIPESPHFVIVGANANRGVAEMIHNNFHRWENVAPNMYARTKGVGWKYEWSYRWERTGNSPYTELERQELFTTHYNAWDQFSSLYLALHTNINTVARTLAGVGDCHYPVNVHPIIDGGYSYGANRWGHSTYKYWKQPILPLNENDAPDPRLGESTPVRAVTWRVEVPWSSGVDYQRSFIVWAYSAMPHGPGQHRNVTAQVEPNQMPMFVHNNWWLYFADHENYLEPIRAARRASQTVERFPDAPWEYCTLAYTSNQWRQMGLPVSRHTVTVTQTGEGTVHGAGEYLWGTGALLTSAPPAKAWIYNGDVYEGSEWFSVIVTEDATVYALFDPLPSITITSVAEIVEAPHDNYVLAGTNNPQVAGTMSWTNDLAEAYGTQPAETSWIIENIPLVVGMNTITVSGTNALGIRAEDAHTVEVLPEGGLLLGIGGIVAFMLRRTRS